MNFTNRDHSLAMPRRIAITDAKAPKQYMSKWNADSNTKGKHEVPFIPTLCARQKAIASAAWTAVDLYKRERSGDVVPE